jgi:type I restriction enzyme S subunit
MSPNPQTLAAEEESKPMLVPKLRFPEFHGAEGWKMTPLERCLDYQQPTPYLVKDERYNPAFKTPVLTAGKTFILGNTNEEHGIFTDGLPVIIFDDFTTATQFVDFPFKAKSSAMKILQAKNGADIKFMFEALQNLSFEVGAHERHWISTFAPMLVPVPSPAEQQKIAECLSSLDELIAAQARKVDALKTHKKGLMQQLFPREGETQPRLRFPEFQNAGEWQLLPLAALADKIMVGIASAATHAYRETGVPMLRNQNIKEGKIDDSSLLYIDPTYEAAHKNKRLRAGDVITVRTGYPGLSAVVPERYNDAQCFTSLITRPKKAVLDANYLCAFVNSEIGKRFILGAEAGGAQKNVNAGSLEALPVYLPGTPEQERIATCLSSLDALITAETQKLETLKTHKRGLMQQLFPSPEEATP